MILHMVNHSDYKMPKTYLKKALNIFFVCLKKKLSDKDFKSLEMSIVFLNSVEARALNKKFRKKNYATDVLSFVGQVPFLGELVMCPQVLTLQARDQKHSFRQETLYMSIHGILHLLGYDHETCQKKAKVMMDLQEELYTKTLRKLK